MPAAPAGAHLLTAFVLHELRTAQPLLPLHVVLDRNRGGAYLAVFGSSISLFGLLLFLTYFLRETLRMSPTAAGVAYLPLVATLMTTSILSQTQLLPRLGPKPLIAAGFGCGAIALALLAHVSVTSTYAQHVLPGGYTAAFSAGAAAYAGAAEGRKLRAARDRPQAAGRTPA